MKNSSTLQVLLPIAMVLTIVTLALAQPLENAAPFEGDILLNKDQQKQVVVAISNTLKPHSRNIVDNRKYLWPNKVVWYRISKSFSDQDKNQILRGMAHISSKSCVKFREVPSTAKIYLDITAESDGCYSQLGYQGQRQLLNLSRFTSCLTHGTIVHELLHALGFMHQQSAMERDRFVRIRWENVLRGKEQNFAKYSTINYGIGYDYGSIMHYGFRAFSKNNLNTIETLVQGVTIGQRNGLSSKDIQKLRIMYQC